MPCIHTYTEQFFVLAFSHRHATHTHEESTSPPAFLLPYGTGLSMNTNPLASPDVELSRKLKAVLKE